MEVLRCLFVGLQTFKRTEEDHHATRVAGPANVFVRDPNSEVIIAVAVKIARCKGLTKHVIGLIRAGHARGALVPVLHWPVESLKPIGRAVEDHHPPGILEVVNPFIGNANG